MKYENMSRTELIKLLKKRNETIEILEKREAVLQKQLENYSDSNVLKLIDDLKKQRKDVYKRQQLLHFQVLLRLLKILFELLRNEVKK